VSPTLSWIKPCGQCLVQMWEGFYYLLFLFVWFVVCFVLNFFVWIKLCVLYVLQIKDIRARWTMKLGTIGWKTHPSTCSSGNPRRFMLPARKIGRDSLSLDFVVILRNWREDEATPHWETSWKPEIETKHGENYKKPNTYHHESCSGMSLSLWVCIRDTEIS
jgi:hypothetical protein